MDKVTEQYLNNIQVFLPVEVVNVYPNSLVDIKPLIYNEIQLPIINNVPVQHLGADSSNCIKFKVKKGQHGLALFSQIDFSEYMENGVESKSDTTETFNLTNAVFVPFLQWKNGGITLPETYDLEIIMGKILINGNVDVVGDVNVDGTLNCTKTINASIDVIGGGISLKNHTHGGVTTGGGTTGGPQ